MKKVRISVDGKTHNTFQKIRNIYTLSEVMSEFALREGELMVIYDKNGKEEKSFRVLNENAGYITHNDSNYSVMEVKINDNIYYFREDFEEFGKMKKLGVIEAIGIKEWR